MALTLAYFLYLAQYAIALVQPVSNPVWRSCGTIGLPHCSVGQRGCYVLVKTDGGAASVPHPKSAVSELSRLGLGVFRSAAQPPCIGRVGFPLL